MFSNKEIFKNTLKQKIASIQSKTIEEATNNDIYKALGTMIREDVSTDWINTNKRYKEDNRKQAYYFSIEFLIGRLLKSNLLNRGKLELCREGLKDLGFDLDEIVKEEPEAGLGNGGLGRLAACFLDSLASLALPGHGCGIRYKYGLFEQKIIDGNQVELPDYWLNDDYVWEVRREDRSCEVRFGGYVEFKVIAGDYVFEHKDYDRVMAVPYDIPVIGYDNKTVNTLRLWNAELPKDEQKYNNCNQDDLYDCLNYKRSVEAISEFLYPDDSRYEGRVLRLKQQYFLCSAGLQSILHTFEKKGLPYGQLPNNVALHINDTHPSLLIPELMRLLMDEKGLGWDEAWQITIETVSYTNHTTLSEALETWPIAMFKQLLPRIFQIVEEINERFCVYLRKRFPGDTQRVASMAILADGQVKMAHLAIVGSHSINGVAKLHTEIIKKREMKSFYQIYPGRFNNKTNGITHRRWLIQANPALASLLTETIGEGWIRRPEELEKIISFKDDINFQNKIADIKKNNKIELARIIKEKRGIVVDNNSIFDIQVKRLHGYKRQLLNVFHIMYLYNQIKENKNLDMTPRTFIFGAKAAASYHFAKRIIKLINSVAQVINNDSKVKDLIKVVFLENYSVSLAEKIIPAADISEQISTAGKEASGTGNMKFMMNGALTIGTMDGANIEIHDLVGKDNIFIFGLNSDQTMKYQKQGGYHSSRLYHNDPVIKQLLDQLVKPNPFSNKEQFSDIFNSLVHNNDEYFVLKDFESYKETQIEVNKEYRDPKKWVQKAITNIAHSGKFSSDRTIAQYANSIWQISSLPEEE